MDSTGDIDLDFSAGDGEDGDDEYTEENGEESEMEDDPIVDDEPAESLKDSEGIPETCVMHS